ncbi:uncharacterized protein CXQ87_005021 [Candidozyma duobushaemuli]|nr:uncharacterized protein CXQ87_005021 [[Candida] duobushaemulonis]PVH14745.1 hypothetical protein CXQ87_005021 [[Candida] duobushaemulonis]
MITEATFIGNIVALGSCPIYVVIITLLKPEQHDYDMNILSIEIVMADDVDEEGREAAKVTDSEKNVLKKQVWMSAFANIIILFGCHILIPLALYGSGYESTKGAFVFFIVVNIIWAVLAAGYIILVPLWQGREAIKTVTGVLLGKKRPQPVSDNMNSESHDSIELLVSGKGTDNAT